MCACVWLTDSLRDRVVICYELASKSWLVGWMITLLLSLLRTSIVALRFSGVQRGLALKK